MGYSLLNFSTFYLDTLYLFNLNTYSNKNTMQMLLVTSGNLQRCHYKIMKLLQFFGLKVCSRLSCLSPTHHIFTCAHLHFTFFPFPPLQLLNSSLVLLSLLFLIKPLFPPLPFSLKAFISAQKYWNIDVLIQYRTYRC